jgi:hypothetical protein
MKRNYSLISGIFKSYSKLGLKEVYDRMVRIHFCLFRWSHIYKFLLFLTCALVLYIFLI